MPRIEIEGREVIISENLDRVTSDWLELSKEKCGSPGIPVAIKNRHQLKILTHLSHANTAFPYSDGQLVVLIVALDDTDEIDEAIVAHEILHWILGLEGFRDFKDYKRPNNDCQIMLGSVLSHVPLNQKLTSYGFEYLHQYDSLADGVIAAVKRREDWELARVELIAKSLLCVDILQNCSPEKKQVLTDALNANMKLSECVQGCLDVLSHYDLQNCESNRRAGQKLINHLALNKFGHYVEFNSIPELRARLKTGRTA